MFQDIVLEFLLVSCHRELCMLTYFLISCPRDQRVVIMEIKVYPKMPQCHVMKM